MLDDHSCPYDVLSFSLRSGIMNSITEIAEIAHETIRIYDQTLGNYGQASWTLCEQWERDTVLNGVIAIENGSVVVPKDSHENWMKEKYDKGWVYGKEKNTDKSVGALTHPSLVPFDKLPDAQRTKDFLFFFITKILLGRASTYLGNVK